MTGPLDFYNDMQRMVLRKGEATAKGGHAFQFLLQLAATYNGEAFPLDLFELRAVDEAISDDMLLCIDALRWGKSDVHSPVPDGDSPVRAEIDQWGLKWPEAQQPFAVSVTNSYPTPLNNAALGATWDAAWSALDRPLPAGLQAELMTAWSEPHRQYHDQRHLRECLARWMRSRGHSPRAGEVALALWFHDAIHDPKAPVSGSNELNSAAWAARSLERAGADRDTVQRVHDLVMATQQDAPDALGSSANARLLVDIDLSILGSPAERFERYDQDVRKEYAWVPSFRHHEVRALVLQSFLDRPTLCHGEYALSLLETQARINLAAALSRLAQ